MPKYAAFLRGINVSNRRAKSGDLCAPLERIGLADVATFRASGNVVFAAPGEPVGRLTARIEAALEEALGYDVAVFLRTAREVRAIAQQRPFPPAVVKASQGKLQVAMLSRRPTAKARKAVLALGTADDGLAFGDRELYWLPSGGMSDSELDLKAIGGHVGLTTVRTQGTVEQMAAKYFEA